jgi:hypothetical protein
MPLSLFHIDYEDGDRARADLRVEGLREPWLLRREERSGHFSQACGVTGWIDIAGQRMQIDAVGWRDRSWGRRHGNRPAGNAAHLWGIASASSHFMVNMGATVSAPGTKAGQPSRPWGYVVRDGVLAEVRTVDYEVVSRTKEGCPNRSELVVIDEEGRRTELSGRLVNACPVNWNPNAFVWICQFAWSDGGGTEYVGEHQGAMRSLSPSLR